MRTRSKCCIIGIPDHQGVIHVGGRIGAARGPWAFRKVFSRFSGKGLSKLILQDLGDVKGLSPDVAGNHRRAADFVREGHQSFGFSVVIGGGHDHGFSHLLGVSEALRVQKPKIRLGCLNLDAHLDVRKPSPQITSGSPFFLAIESGVLVPKRFIEFGIQSHCNASDLWNYVDSKRIQVVPFSELRNGKAISIFRKKLKKLASICDAVVLSFDLDAAASAFAPGVSAPQAEGFTSSELIEMMELAGKEKKVISLGIFELNPEHDFDDRTARLAATAAYHFIESALSKSSKV